MSKDTKKKSVLTLPKKEIPLTEAERLRIISWLEKKLYPKKIEKTPQ